MIQQASNDQKLRELRVVWEEALERGESLPIDLLCRDCPELADELGCQIQALRDWDLLRADSSARSSSSSEAAAQAVACAPASACVTLHLSDLHFHDRGGLGVIYKARHQDLPRDVALKFIRQDRSDDPQCSKRFLREAQITARLEHPGIVPSYGVGRDGEQQKPCYAMQLVRGWRRLGAGDPALPRAAGSRPRAEVTGDGPRIPRAAPALQVGMYHGWLRPQPGSPPPRHQAGQHHARAV